MHRSKTSRCGFILIQLPPGSPPLFECAGRLCRRIMKRTIAFTLTTWLAAAILLLGGDSPAFVVLSGVVAFGGFDLLRP